MFLRQTRRKKDGKTHSYWSVVENQRLQGGRVVQRHLEKFAAVQMIEGHLPTTDGRELLLTRYTQPEPELQLLIQQLKLQLPPQPPPKITAVARTT